MRDTQEKLFKREFPLKIPNRSMPLETIAVVQQQMKKKLNQEAKALKNRRVVSLLLIKTNSRSITHLVAPISDFFIRIISGFSDIFLSLSLKIKSYH